MRVWRVLERMGAQGHVETAADVGEPLFPQHYSAFMDIAGNKRIHAVAL